MSNTSLNQNKLLAIIDKLFVFNINIQTNKKEIVVNPRLNEKTLQLIVEETRKLIIELYIGCEHDFLTGLEIFEAIVEKQIIDTSKQQIQLLQTNIDTTLASSDISETIKPTDEMPEEETIEPETDTTPETGTTPETVTTPETGTDEPISSFETEVENEIIKEDEDINIPPPSIEIIPTTTNEIPVVSTTAPVFTAPVFPSTTATASVFTAPVFPSAPTTAPATATATATAPILPPAPAPIAVGGTRKKRYNKYFKKTRKGIRKY